MVRNLDEKLTWEVESKNIFSGEVVGMDKIPGYKAISRNDNQVVLSVMKNSYSPMLNAEFLEIVENIRTISGFKLEGFNEFKQGKKVLAFLKNDREDFYIGGHKIEDYFLLGNSFDGSSSFFQGTSTELIRCTNAFSKIQVHSKIRHTKNIKDKISEQIQCRIRQDIQFKVINKIDEDFSYDIEDIIHEDGPFEDIEFNKRRIHDSINDLIKQNLPR